MRQLIARIPPELHDRIKRKAAAEHRSMNAVVTEALEAVVEDEDERAPRERLAERLQAAGLRVVEPPQHDRPILTREEISAMTRGAGTISDLIEADRARR